MQEINDIDFKAKVSNRISCLRKKRGLKQKELAELIGCKRPAISRLESGKESGTIITYKLISEALGVTLSEFFENI